MESDDELQADLASVLVIPVAQYGHSHLVGLLTEYGADLAETDPSRGGPPLMHAANNGHAGTVTALLKVTHIEIIIDHARKIRTGDETGIDVEKIIQSGIARFSDQRGILWVGLARYWINMGDHEKARDTFEEGILSVNTVRDFTIIFDTYAEAEEAILGILLEQADARAHKGKFDEEADADLEIRMDRMEQLMNRRPFLLSHVILRQNPNNVNEWQKRAALWGDDKTAVLQTYLEAIEAINPKKAVGQFHELWINYAKVYEEGGDLDSARRIMEKNAVVLSALAK